MCVHPSSLSAPFVKYTLREIGREGGVRARVQEGAAGKRERDRETLRERGRGGREGVRKIEK